MRCIHVSITKWLIIVALTYIMFAALLSNNIFVAGTMMFVLLYVDLIGDIACDYIRRKNAQRELPGQY